VKYQCPKCGSTDTYLARSGGSIDLMMVLRCRCGIFQYVTSDELEDLTYVPPKSLRPANEVPPAVELVPDLAPEPEPPDEGTCAWHDCMAEARETSIYCSRDCSNKNARARYQARKSLDG
jgi:hypothetical protein